MHSTVLPQEVYYLLRAQISVLIKLTSLSALSRAKILKTFAARNPRKKKNLQIPLAWIYIMNYSNVFSNILIH